MRPRSDQTTLDVIVIGAGPAGIAAAIQLARLGHEPAVFEKNRVGGLLLNAHCVENYPGLSKGITGLALARMMEKHLASQSVPVRFEDVLRVGTIDGHATVDTANGRLQARALIIASGTRPRTLESPPIPPEVRPRVLSEVCPIRDAEGKSIAIIGAGDAAFDYALTLETRNSVVILNRSRSARCTRSLFERAGASPNIRHLTETRVIGIEPRRLEGGEQIGLRCAQRDRSLDLQADYLLLAIGREPEIAFLSPSLQERMSAEGGNVTARNGGPIWFAGDVARGNARQTAIAVGDGVAAAVQIHQVLTETKP